MKNGNLKQTYLIPDLPPEGLETLKVLKALAPAHRYLAELKGAAQSIPNQGILLNTLALQEAKASSEIENIVTTQDELFRARLFPDGPASAEAKEVARYNEALKAGFEFMRKNDGLLTNRALINMFRTLEQREDGFRRTSGTALKNDRTGEIVYVPPQEPDQVAKHMADLENFINDDSISDLDPIIKMAVIHHQFESIHPFPDGNGRIGRILNVLYLTRSELLTIPILYLSRHITRNKADYYGLLQAVRDSGGRLEDWEEWLLYMLTATSETAKLSLDIVTDLKALIQSTKVRIRSEMPRVYSQDLINNLFRHPYTRIEYVMDDLGVSRPTATKYLEQLVENGFLDKFVEGRNNYYINQPLVALFVKVAEA
jgi:Fic family protein